MILGSYCLDFGESVGSLESIEVGESELLVDLLNSLQLGDAEV